MAEITGSASTAGGGGDATDTNNSNATDKEVTTKRSSNRQRAPTSAELNAMFKDHPWCKGLGGEWSKDNVKLSSKSGETELSHNKPSGPVANITGCGIWRKVFKKDQDRVKNSGRMGGTSFKPSNGWRQISIDDLFRQGKCSGGRGSVSQTGNRWRKLSLDELGLGGKRGGSVGNNSTSERSCGSESISGRKDGRLNRASGLDKGNSSRPDSGLSHPSSSTTSGYVTDGSSYDSGSPGRNISSEGPKSSDGQGKSLGDGSVTLDDKSTR